MIVITSTYTSPLDEGGVHRDAHIAFLTTLSDAGHIIAFGRANPPTGGVVLATGWTADEARAAFAEDPYVLAGVSDYAFVEFSPAFVESGLERLKD